MSKNYKRCPRCNFKTPITMKKCGRCGLNYDKFILATNQEAKSAFRMGEKERILYTNKIPSDVSKPKILIQCIMGGWFGLHFFSLGKIWRGLFQILGFICCFIYSYFAVTQGIRTGFLGNFILGIGVIWLSSFIIWASNSLSILFNKFKYPVSLPYKNSETEKGE